MRLLKEKEVKRKENIWLWYWEKNKGFPVVTAFVAALICVQLFKAAGVISFEFLFPYLVLIFFMYGFLHKYWVIGICKKWMHSEEKSLKLVAAVAAAAAVQGVFAEGAIKSESSAALISAIILILVLYLYIWFNLNIRWIQGDTVLRRTMRFICLHYC